MLIKLGEKIRELRRRDGRTQGELAAALGVTSQAVSRWESGGSYPDLEIIPSIANFFGITIDDLFGHTQKREQRIRAVLDQVKGYDIPHRSDDEWVDESLSLLREALAEFPQDETLLIALADTLFEAGWRRHREWLDYDAKGFIRYDYDRKKKNTYWAEAIKIYENLASSAKSPVFVTQSISRLVTLYRTLGDSATAVAYANRMPTLEHSRELLLTSADDGKAGAIYIGHALLKMAHAFAEQVIYGLIANKKHFTDDLPIEKLKGVIRIFELLCDDGNFGEYNEVLRNIYLYLSRIQWERGYHDEAFASLDEALIHSRALDRMADGKEHFFTAPLVAFVKCKEITRNDLTAQLSEDWPFWGNPDYSEVEREIKVDPRWQDWVKRTLE
ncbi:MAG: helix-turn-helix transcriptional regulator [Clostridia bacterium]|nr:helix-turn-helix transcriptional regulator [Clostridia bacterium]